MIKRRALAAGLPSSIGCHTFRADPGGIDEDTVATGGVGVAASVGGAKLWRKRLFPRVIKPAVPELFVLGRARLPLVNHECPSRRCYRRRVVDALCRGAG